MAIRRWAIAIGFGGPALWLLTLGPRGEYAVPPDRTVVHYWEQWTGVEGAAMQRIVDRFNDSVGVERKIWVDYNSVSNVDRRTLIATAGGDPPDLAGLYDHIIPQFADQGALTDLGPWVQEFDIDVASFKPVWLDICTYDNKLTALPSTPYTIALYYNRRLFREAGLDPDRPPKSIAELDEAALRLTKYDSDGKIIQLGFTVSPAMLGWWHWVWPYFFNGSLWDGEKFTLASPEGMAAFEWIDRQRRAIGESELLAFEATAGAIEGSQNPFLSERLAMVFQGPWMSGWAKVYAPDLDYGVAPFPSVTAERANAFASTDVFVIPRGARQPREAMEFLSFVLQPKVMEELCSAHGKTSPYREPSTEFFSNHPNLFLSVFEEMARSDTAFGYPKMPTFAQVWTETLYMVENILRGVAEPQAALPLTQEKIDVIVNDHRRMAAKRNPVESGSEF